MNYVCLYFITCPNTAGPSTEYPNTPILQLIKAISFYRLFPFASTEGIFVKVREEAIFYGTACLLEF